MFDRSLVVLDCLPYFAVAIAVAIVVNQDVDPIRGIVRRPQATKVFIVKRSLDAVCGRAMPRKD